MATNSTNRGMTVIAESSSTRTEWTLVDGAEVVHRAHTVGLNPFFQTRREISHIIRLHLPPVFFRHRWKHVHYYGAGCSGPEKNSIVEASLVAQFKTPVTVMSDLLGAARGLLVRERGLACILGTGSNSCYYDGERIVRNVRPLGFILGDEGGGAALGKIFIGDALKGFAPAPLVEAFFDKFRVTPDEIMDAVYNNASANRNLRDYSFFLAEHLDSDYVHALIDREFDSFFVRNLRQYDDYDRLPVAFVGSVATTYSEILIDVAARHNVRVQKIVRTSMPGLVAYHAQ